MIDQMKHMKQTLMARVQSEINRNLDCVDTKELGEAVDMIKDLSQAIYYCTITDAMEQGTEEQKYRNAAWEESKMYYGGNRGGNTSGNMNGNRGENMNSGTRGYYIPREMIDYQQMGPYRNQQMPPEIHDYREGKSPLTRKMYMESKRENNKSKQLTHLDKYMQDLSKDITEMIQDASPEEKELLKQKISGMAKLI